MKKCIQLILGGIAALFVCCVLISSAHAETYGDLTWNLDANGLLTISGEGPMEDFAATSESAWRARSDEIKTVVIENGVTSIGKLAFFNCNNLTGVTIPDSVINIGDAAFMGCSCLTDVRLPEGLTVIPEFLFSVCSSLTNITIPDSVTSIKARAFYSSGLTEITIPAGVRSIGANAFQNFKLKTVTSLLKDETVNVSFDFFLFRGSPVFYCYKNTAFDRYASGRYEVKYLVLDDDTPQPTSEPDPSPTPRPEPSPYTDDALIEAFVNRCYEDILGRPADEGGLDYWKGELKSGAASGADIVSRFCGSTEFQSRGYPNIVVTAILYHTMLDRPADNEGLAYWSGCLDAGESLDTVIAGFASSEEFAALCVEYGIRPNNGTVPDPEPEPEPEVSAVEKFVQRCYTLILGRDGEEEGVQYWAGLFREGNTTGYVIVSQFCESPEFLSRGLSNSAIVEILYQTMLDRPADEEGLAYWTGRLDAGETVDAIVAGFAVSQEFTAICAGYGIVPIWIPEASEPVELLAAPEAPVPEIPEEQEIEVLTDFTPLPEEKFEIILSEMILEE